MADLGQHKDKIAAARRARLERSKSVAIADPMVGYPKPKEAERKPSPFAKTEPAAAPEKPQEAPRISKGAPAASATPPVENEVNAETAPPKTSEPPVAEGKKEKLAQPEKTEPSSAAESDAPEIQVKLAYQVREQDYPRVRAVAEKLGVTDEHIVKKAALMVSPIEADFRENPATRVGPSYRRAVRFPKASVEAWLDKHDPLRIASRLGHSLRDVGDNAFDRAMEALLKSLETKKAKR